MDDIEAPEICLNCGCDEEGCITAEFSAYGSLVQCDHCFDLGYFVRDNPNSRLLVELFGTDLRKATTAGLVFDPTGARLVADKLIRELAYEVERRYLSEYVVGVGIDSIPVVSQLVLLSSVLPDIPMLEGSYIREETKTHGTQERIEGQIPPYGSRVTVVLGDVRSFYDFKERVLELWGRGYSVGLVLAVFHWPVDKQEFDDDGQTYFALFRMGEVEGDWMGISEQT